MPLIPNPRPVLHLGIKAVAVVVFALAPAHALDVLVPAPAVAADQK